MTYLTLFITMAYEHMISLPTCEIPAFPPPSSLSPLILMFMLIKYPFYCHIVSAISLPHCWLLTKSYQIKWKFFRSTFSFNSVLLNSNLWSTAFWKEHQNHSMRKKKESFQQMVLRQWGVHMQRIKLNGIMLEHIHKLI